MTFLAPVAGLIALGLALPPLLALYFLKLRRRPVRVSSTFLWAQAARDLQVNVPFRWLRVRTSLLLQLLALLLLAGAIARPAVRAGAGVGGRLAIVIDRSASMNALLEAGSAGAAGQRTRLDEAKAQARALIDRLPRGSQAMLLSFAASPRIEAGFTSDRSALRDALDRLTPTDEPDDFPRALAILEAALTRASEEADAGDAAASVVIFSDGGFASASRSWTASLGGADVRFVRTAPPPSQPASNVGIAALSAERDFDAPATLRALVRFVNAGERAVEVAAGVYLDDAPLGALAATVPTARGGEPGQAVATLTAQVEAGGLLRAQIPGRDALDADNVAWSAVPPARPLRVTVVAPAGRADPFLLRALAAAGSARVETLDPATAAGRIASAGAATAWDLLVFDRADLAGVDVDVATLSFGAAAHLPGVEVDGSRRAARFAAWERAHPLLRDVVLDAVELADAPVFALGDEAGAPGLAPIALAEAGPIIVASAASASDTGDDAVGQTLHVAVSFALAQSTWPLDPSFAIFIANALERLPGGGRRLAGAHVRTGEALVVAPAPGARSVRLEGPVAVEAAVPPGAGAISLGLASRVGVYRALGAAARDATLPVNLLSAAESSLATAQSLRIAGQSRPAQSAAELAPREVWRWFVALAAVLLTIDWLAYALGMRVGRR